MANIIDTDGIRDLMVAIVSIAAPIAATMSRRNLTATGSALGGNRIQNTPDMSLSQVRDQVGLDNELDPCEHAISLSDLRESGLVHDRLEWRRSGMQTN